MDANIKIRGVPETVNNIRIFGNIAEDEIALKMVSIVDQFVTDARFFAPVSKTGSGGKPAGYLRDHIIGRVFKQIRGIVTVGRIVSKAPYSYYQEYGTVNHGAQPFMTPAYNKNKERIIRDFKSALQDAMIQSSRKIGITRTRVLS